MKKKNEIPSIINKVDNSQVQWLGYLIILQEWKINKLSNEVKEKIVTDLRNTEDFKNYDLDPNQLESIIGDFSIFPMSHQNRIILFWKSINKYRSIYKLENQLKHNVLERSNKYNKVSKSGAATGHKGNFKENNIRKTWNYRNSKKKRLEEKNRKTNSIINNNDNNNNNYICLNNNYYDEEEEEDYYSNNESDGETDNDEEKEDNNNNNNSNVEFRIDDKIMNSFYNDTQNTSNNGNNPRNNKNNNRYKAKSFIKTNKHGEIIQNTDDEDDEDDEDEGNEIEENDDDKVSNSSKSNNSGGSNIGTSSDDELNTNEFERFSNNFKSLRSNKSLETSLLSSSSNHNVNGKHGQLDESSTLSTKVLQNAPIRSVLVSPPLSDCNLYNSNNSTPYNQSPIYNNQSNINIFNETNNNINNNNNNNNFSSINMIKIASTNNINNINHHNNNMIMYMNSNIQNNINNNGLSYYNDNNNNNLYNQSFNFQN